MTEIPAGWQLVAYQRGPNGACAFYDYGVNKWRYCGADFGESSEPFPTPAAAIAALEEAERG